MGKVPLLTSRFSGVELGPQLYPRSVGSSIIGPLRSCSRYPVLGVVGWGGVESPALDDMAGKYVYRRETSFTLPTGFAWFS